MGEIKPIIFLQARLTSTRFPNKVIAFLQEKTIIDWCIEACRNSGYPIVVTIPSTRKNDGIESYLQTKYASDKRDIMLFRHWEDQDVLKRFVKASQSFPDFNIIIRICADSPLLNPEDITIALELYKKRGYFTMVNHVQVFSVEELVYADRVDTIMDSREDVVRTMHATVDYPEDIERIEEELMLDESPTMNNRKKSLGI